MGLVWMGLEMEMEKGRARVRRLGEGGVWVNMKNEYDGKRRVIWEID